jgi:hypothetical protein
MNNITFSKLAYAAISTPILEFTVVNRTGYDHCSGGPYAWLDDLQQWDMLDSWSLESNLV